MSDEPEPKDNGADWKMPEPIFRSTEGHTPKRPPVKTDQDDVDTESPDAYYADEVDTLSPDFFEADTEIPNARDIDTEIPTLSQDDIDTEIPSFADAAGDKNSAPPDDALQNSVVSNPPRPRAVVQAPC